MTDKSSFSEVRLDVNAGASPSPTATEPDTPFRILVLGDFSGRSYKGTTPSTRWKPVAVDRDNFEEVLAGMGVSLTVGEGSRDPTLSINFRELADFHPDQIYAQNTLFQALRDVRRKLEDPSTFTEAKAEIHAWASAPTPASASTQVAQQSASIRPSPPDFEALTSGSLLDSILQDTEAESPLRRTGRDDFRLFVDSMTAPYVIPPEDPDLPSLRKLVNAESGARMRAILHHATFQALEAAWRAVFLLVRKIETSSQLQLYLLDISKAEIEADLASSEELQSSAIWRLLVEETVGTPDADPWAVVVANYAFSTTVGDAQTLGRLAKIVRFAGAPLLGEIDLGTSGTEIEGVVQQWELLRLSPEASWIGLAMPRFLLRLPYGRNTEPVETFDFEEMPGPPNHQEYLWGNPAFACAQLLAEAFTDYGWGMRPGVYSEISGLPVHIYEAEGEATVKPCAEVLLSERDIDLILDQGYMPLVSIRGQDAVRLARFQSIAKPLRALSGRWES